MAQPASPAAALALPPAELAPLAAAGAVVLHFYDLTCPFCYVGQFKSALLAAPGRPVVELPFQAHPEVPAEGQTVATRTGPMYEVLAAEARQAGLPLRWQPHLPNSRLALGAAEWTRRRQPACFAPYQRRLFQAHFADGLDLGQVPVLLRLAAQVGVDAARLGPALADGTAGAAVAPAEQLGRRLGVTGTPAWASAGTGIVGNQPAAVFEQFAAHLSSLPASPTP